MSLEISRGRVGQHEDVVVGTTVDASEAIPNQNASLLMINLTSGSTTTVDIYGSPTKDGPYYLMALDSVDLSSPVAEDRWNVLPSATFAAPWIKLVGDSVGVVMVSGKS